MRKIELLQKKLLEKCGRPCCLYKPERFDGGLYGPYPKRIKGVEFDGLKLDFKKK